MDDKYDIVNRPKHYVGSTSLECIDAMCIAFGKESVLDFCLCNAFKYMWRCKNKNGIQDLQKARWYLDTADLFIKQLMYQNDKYYTDKMNCLRDTLSKLVLEVNDGNLVKQH